jgi:hypothetical protein
MFTLMSQLVKKFLLAGLVLTLGLTALPATAAFAASSGPSTPPAPTPINPNQVLQQRFADEKATNGHQGTELALSGPLINVAKLVIAAANKHGLNTSNAEAALDNFQRAVIVARLIHGYAQDIIAAHPGFDAQGFVTNRVLAAQTVNNLGNVQENFRDAYHPPFNDLVEALRDLIKQFSPSQPIPALLS